MKALDDLEDSRTLSKVEVKEWKGLREVVVEEDWKVVLD